MHKRDLGLTLDHEQCRCSVCNFSESRVVCIQCLGLTLGQGHCEYTIWGRL